MGTVAGAIKVSDKAVGMVVGAVKASDKIVDTTKTAKKVSDAVQDAELAAKSIDKISDAGKSAAKVAGDLKIGEKVEQWIDEAGNIKWPPNRGFDGDPITKTLEVGTKIDRYGYESGTFVSPKGTPYANRSLAPGTNLKPYNVYEVVKPIDVQAGKIAPWFGEPGGGIQYEFSQSISQLLEKGIIRRVEP